MANSAATVVALVVALALPACRLLHRGERAHEEPPPIDLNTASLRKVEALPGITPSMARRIVDGRPYDEAEDLVDRGILTESELHRIADRIVVERRAR